MTAGAPDALDHGLLDRASGVLLAQACGDGLGQYSPGEWSADTQMAICVARVTARGLSVARGEGLDLVAAGFEEWFAGRPADVGGNGALMRTAIVGLVALADRGATAAAATAVARLTHADPLAAQSCVLWSEAVRVAVIGGGFDVRAGLDLLDGAARARWEEWIADAERERPRADLRVNGFTVTALQAAWHAIVRSPHFFAGPSRRYEESVALVTDALQRAVRIGGDTDTVAAIAGALVGARCGARLLPRAWTGALHGWPGMRAIDLSALARLTAQRGLAAPATGQACPVCEMAVAPYARYPRLVCGWCDDWVADEDGRPLRLSNTDLMGHGYAATYEDGTPASEAARAGRVYINGRPCRAREAYMGGIVVETLEE